MPEDMAYAAGVLPVRIIGSQEPPVLAERHMAQWCCPFSRGALHQGLKGEYDYLDAVVFPFTCLHVKTAFYYWEINVPNTVAYELELPKAMERRAARPFLDKELTLFKGWLEEFTGRRISGEDLERGIDICNSNRRLMKEIYSLRRDDPPPLTGVEALEMVLSSQLMDKEEHNPLLSEWLAELRNRTDVPEERVRLMVVGSVIDKPEVLKLVEDMGANVVVDDLCTGTRYFWNEVIPERDPLSAIGKRLMDRVVCPCKIAGDRRYQQIFELIRAYRVDGVLVFHQKFCNPHGNDYPHLRGLFDKNGIPCLLLELDVPIPGGQIKNRVQTFIEMIEAQKSGEAALS
jgi:benzoyl-CoA reductase subunit C